MSINARMPVLLLCAAGLLMAADANAARSEAKALARDGVFCKVLADDDDPEETHGCVFVPGQFGRHDFTNRNARAGYVVSMLGPDCDEIEILADEEFAREGESEPKYRRVSVSCIED